MRQCNLKTTQKLSVSELRAFPPVWCVQYLSAFQQAARNYPPLLSAPLRLSGGIRLCRCHAGRSGLSRQNGCPARPVLAWLSRRTCPPAVPPLQLFASTPGVNWPNGPRGGWPPPPVSPHAGRCIANRARIAASVAASNRAAEPCASIFSLRTVACATRSGLPCSSHSFGELLLATTG